MDDDQETMDADDQQTLEKIAHEWLVTRDLIAVFVAELRPDLSPELHESYATALLARLAAHDPPILTAFMERE